MLSDLGLRLAHIQYCRKCCASAYIVYSLYYLWPLAVESVLFHSVWCLVTLIFILSHLAL